jgi:hypothetical protein
MALVYEPGLVLYLYPAELLHFGATHTAPEDEAVTSESWFLCLSADAREGLWTPLHATRGQDRKHIHESAKTGHPRFTQGMSWYSTDDLWTIPHKAIQRAAAAAGDKTTAKQQNRVALDWVPAPSRFGGRDGDAEASAR